MIFSNVLKYAFSAALLMAAVVPAHARTEFPAVGGKGDKARPVECASDEYLVGFAGRLGLWIDRLQPLCAKVLPDGRRDSINDTIKASGGKGGSPAEFSCPADSFISSVTSSTFKGKGAYLSDITFTCYRPLDGMIMTDKPRFGAGTGASGYANSCPRGEIATGVNLRYGVHVNAFGLICDTLYIPKGAPVASSKPKPSSTSTSTASSEPSVSTLTFTGEWKTTTSANKHFTLYLNPVITSALIPGTQIQFTGQFVSADGSRQSNGQIQGSAIYPSALLNFTYVQPGLEAAGTGVFTLSSDGKTLNGTAVHMSKETFAWNGGRTSAPSTPAAPAGSKVSSTSSSSETSAPPATSTLEEQTDRPGEDYSQTNSDDPVKCRAKCLKDKSCAAWTWVQEGVQGDKGQCYLKDRVPSARPADCCVSGVITR